MAGYEVYYDVPEKEWQRFFDHFTAQHKGERVSVDELAGKSEASCGSGRRVSEGATLENITLHSDRGGRRIDVRLSDWKQGRIYCESPRQVRMEQLRSDSPGSLRLQGERYSLLLCFESPLVPGTMNGLD